MYKVPELSTYEFQKSVQSILSTPPLSPSKGDRYIIGSGATGVWSGKTNQIAEYDSSWEYIVPFQGMISYIITYDRIFQYTTFWDELIAIGKEIITTQNTGVTLTISQFGETIVCDSILDQTFTLPSVNSNHLGYWYRFVKFGSGKVTIQASDNDTIADSGAGKTIYNSKTNQTWATLTLLLGNETQWILLDGHGTWVTTT